MLDARKRLDLVLWLVAVHSAFVGLGLILMPASTMPFFGFEVTGEKFFALQGGVFHLVMAVAYALATIRAERYRGLILLAILAKFMATVFLFVYYLFVERIWTVLLSGAGDCLMGIAILVAFLNYRRGKKRPDRDFDNQSSEAM